MINIDNIFEKKYIDKGAYKVPDGYFDTLATRIIDKVNNSQQATHKKDRNIFIFINKIPFKKYIAAACMTGVIAAVAHFSFTEDKNATNNTVAEDQKDVITEQYVNDCMTYAMIDNDDIALYLEE